MCKFCSAKYSQTTILLTLPLLETNGSDVFLSSPNDLLFVGDKYEGSDTILLTTGLGGGLLLGGGFLS